MLLNRIPSPGLVVLHCLGNWVKSSHAVIKCITREVGCVQANCVPSSADVEWET